MMAVNHFQLQIESYARWKEGLISAIQDLQAWLDTQDLENEGENSLRIFESIEALKKDRLNIAFVAEFSRGKTELINAIFFSDFKRRLLPSEAGRTTMCPTELFYDHEASGPYLRLLPIETRLEDASIQEYKQEPIQWTQINLQMDSPADMEKALREIVQTREVSIKQADRLGLYNAELYPHLASNDPETTLIEIPKWRHALISFPHPLLKQGLVILDTPGLNALGSEPELTLNMLPAAHATFFILAADTGVTHSDLDIWQYHIHRNKRKQDKGTAVILNKIDTLWDDLKDERQIKESIQEQVRKTSSILGIGQQNIFTVSAQKGLLARISQDEALLSRSELPKLENYLANSILPIRENLLRESIQSDLGGILEEHIGLVQSRLLAVHQQLHQIRNLNGKNANAIEGLILKTREEQTVYTRHVEAFNSSKRLLQRQVIELKKALDLRKIDSLIEDTRKSMAGSWTTQGLKKAMKTLFDRIQDMTIQGTDSSETLQQLNQAVYRKFHKELGLPEMKPRVFRVQQYLEQLNNLYEEAEQYRNSPVMTMSEQNFVIKRFFIQLVSQGRNILYKANEDLDRWIKEALQPLAKQIQERRKSMEQRLATLRKIHDSRDSLEGKISELESDYSKLKATLDKLTGIRQRLNQDIPSVSE